MRQKKSLYLVIAFLVICSSIFILTLYKSEIVYHGSARMHYLSYYIVSSVGVIFCMVLMRLNNKLRNEAIIFTIFIMAGLYIVELIVASGAIQILDKKSLRLQAKNIDHRTESQFLSVAFPQFSRHSIMSKLNWRESHEENEIYV